MHPALAPETPAGVRFVNPGLAASRPGAPADAAFLTPGTLPLGPAQARRYVQDALEFGGRFQASGDIAGYGARSDGPAYAGAGADMRAEMADLARFASGAAAAPAQPAATSPETALLASQMTLLLAWTLEERILELAELASGLATSSQRFEKALGLDEEDAESEPDTSASAAGVGDVASLAADHAEAVASFPWRRSVEHLAAFLPEDARLLTCEPFLREAWETAGATLTQADPKQNPDELPDWALELAAQGRLWRTRAPLWLLAGYRGPQSGRPALDREALALYLQPETAH